MTVLRVPYASIKDVNFYANVRSRTGNHRRNSWDRLRQIAQDIATARRRAANRAARKARRRNRTAK